MKHCSKCDIHIADDINNCPLCGRDLAEPSQTQSFTSYPNNKTWYDKRKMALNILLFVVLIGTAICLAVDLFVNRAITYTWYTISGCAMF